MKMMKKISCVLIVTVLAVALMSAFGVTSFAADIVASGTCGAQGDNLTWTLDSDGTLTISGAGEMTEFDDMAPWYYYSSSIFKVNIDEQVKSIGSFAFSDCTMLTEITVPDSIVYIGIGAFGNTGYYNDESNWENNLLYVRDFCIAAKKSISDSIVIKDGTKSISDCLFYNCISLTEITIPESVTTIGDSAFYGCTGLEKINWNAVDIKSVDSDCFRNAGTSGDGIDFVFGDSVKTIPDNICRNMNLKTVTISNSVTKIGRFAFYGRTGLKNITIGNGVETIGDSAFSGCTGLTEIAIPDSVTSIGAYAFSGCKGLKNVTIGNSVVGIGDSAFSGCTELKNVTIGDSVKGIGSAAFYNCRFLAEITIPNSVIEIDNSAFSGCTGLKNVTIGNSVEAIGDSAFFGCRGLKEITIPDSITLLCNSAFSGCTGLEKIHWNAVDIKSISSTCFQNAGTSGNGIDLVFGDSVKTIPSGICGDEGDPSCIKLRSVSIGNNVTEIGYAAFFCSGITEIIIPESVTTIGVCAFAYSAIEKISIPEGVVSIESYTFEGCQNLKSVLIGNGVKKIGERAFYGCTGLTDIAIPDSVTSIGASAFSSCSGLTSVTFGNSIATISQNAFDNCTSLETIVLPESVSYVEAYAFRNSGLKDIEIRNSRCVIEYDAATIPVGAVIHGYVNSPAQLYAQMYARDFVPFEATDCAHTYSAWTVDAEATCTERGLSHRSCLLCGDVDIAVTPATGHTDENGDDLCDVCGASLAANIPGGDDTPCVTHTYSDWVIDAEPTCTERGLSHRTCRKCGDLEISVIPATGHTDENGDDLCDACGESLAPEEPGEDEPTENGLMKIMQKIVDFFSRLAAWLKSMFAKTA